MAAPRFAVLLHGKVGGLKSDLPALEGRREEPSESPRAFDNAAASPAMLALCAASVERLVVSPNRGQYAVDVLGRSRSPEVGPLLDALFSPAASTHAPTAPGAWFSTNWFHANKGARNLQLDHIWANQSTGDDIVTHKLVNVTVSRHLRCERRIFPSCSQGNHEG